MNKGGRVYSKLQRHLQSQHYKVVSFVHDFEPIKNDYDVCDVIVFLQSNDLILKKEQVGCFQAFLTKGKSVICLLSESEKETTKSSVADHDKEEITMKAFLARFGIGSENNCVIQTTYHENAHPKIASIADGLYHHTFSDYGGKVSQYGGTDGNSMEIGALDQDLFSCDTLKDKDSWAMVYPKGCTLHVQAPAVTILCSGSMSSFPMKRPIAAAWDGEYAHLIRLQDVKTDEETSSIDEGRKSRKDHGYRRGRLVVVGSSEMFSDAWFEKEDNSAIWDVLIHYCLYHDLNYSASRPMFEQIDLLHDVTISLVDSQTQKKGQIHQVSVDSTPTSAPDMESLSKRSKSCIEWDWSSNRHLNAPQDTDTDRILTCKDWMYDDVLSFGNSHVTAQIRDLYQDLDVPFEPLSLIRPKWECPMPPLQLAVYNAPFGVLTPHIQLEKFDLDEDLSDQMEKLYRCTYKYAKSPSHGINLLSMIAHSPSEQNQDVDLHQSTADRCSIKELESYVQEVGHDIIQLSYDLCKKGGKEILYHIFIQVRSCAIYFYDFGLHTFNAFFVSSW